MSTLYPDNEPGRLGLIPFDDRLLDQITRAASESPRRRSIVRFHEHREPVQRMLNAIEPESYARPHRHTDPDKHEAFVALRGSLLAVRFSAEGEPLEGVVASADGPVKGIEVPPGAWHSVVAIEPGTVVFEVNAGPYDAATHKEFASWAPPEDDQEGGRAFIAGLRARFASLLPQVDAVDRIEAEEEDIC